MTLLTVTIDAMRRLSRTAAAAAVAVFLVAGLATTAAAISARDVTWVKRTVADVTVEIPDNWVVKDDLGGGALEFLETDDPDAASFAIFRDSDLTDLGKGGQIATSSAIVGGEIGRRTDWRRGGRRGATIILADRGDGGQLAVHFSAAQKDWNRVRPLFRHSIRSIRIRPVPAAAPTAEAETTPAEKQTARPLPKPDKPARTGERRTTPEPKKAAFKTVDGAGFTVRIPQQWQWERIEAGNDTTFSTGDEARHIGLRFGILPVDGDFDGLLDAFIDGTRTRLAYDELVESIELPDDPNWSWRETYEGEAEDGTLVTFDVTLNDLVEPAIAMILMRPSETSGADDKLLETIVASVSFADVPDADAPVADDPPAQSQRPEQPAETAPPADDTADDAADRPADEQTTADRAPAAADETPRKPADQTARQPVAAEPSTAGRTQPREPAETAVPAEPPSAADETPPADHSVDTSKADPSTTFDPAAASANSTRTTPPAGTDSRREAGPPAETSASVSGEKAAGQPTEPQKPRQLASLPDAEAASRDVYVRAVPAHGFALRVPDGWTIQEDRHDKVDSWRLRDKSWRAGNGSTGLFSVTATVSPAKGGAEPEALFRQTVEHFSTAVLKGAVILAEGRTTFANRQMFHADLSGTLDAGTAAPHETVLRVIVDRWGDKLVVLTAFAPADAPEALDTITGERGFVTPLAAQ